MRTPTPSELNNLLAQIHPRSPMGGRDRGMLVLAANTGLRVSELVALDVHHVANPHGQAREWLQLPASIAAKSHKERLIPLNKMARQAVSDILAFNRQRGFSTAAGAPLLVNRKHKRLPVRAVQYLVEALRGKAGLDVQVTPHSLRHYAASQLATSCGNIRVVQQVLGHARISTAEVYTHPTRSELASSMEGIA